MKVRNSAQIEKLYQTCYMDVYSYIMTIMRDSQIAEELTQETFYRAMKSEFKGKSSELTWLCAIAKNLCAGDLSPRTTEASGGAWKRRAK